MSKISDKIINFTVNVLKNWRVGLEVGRQKFTEEKLQRVIFQENSLWSLLFVTEMLPINYILQKRTSLRIKKITEKY